MFLVSHQPAHNNAQHYDQLKAPQLASSCAHTNISVNNTSSSSLLCQMLLAPIAKSSAVSFVDLSIARSRDEASKIIERLNCLAKSQLASSSLSPPPISDYIRIAMTWSSNSKCLFSDDFSTACFNPDGRGAFETHAIRTTQPLRSNAYTYWSVSLSVGACTGTSLMIGVGRARAALATEGYVDGLLGADEHSWALSATGQAWHSNKTHQFCSAFDNNNSNNNGETQIGCLYDGYRGRMAFFCNSRLLGQAFANMPTNEPLYPMVASTVAKSIVRLECAYQSFPTLAELCRTQHFITSA